MNISEVNNTNLLTWIEEIKSMCQPDQIYVCDGTKKEYQEMLDLLVSQGSAMWLNDIERANSILVRSDPADVARVEDRTFICSVNEEDAGPTNNWTDPVKMKKTMTELYSGCMKGRTMYVIPFVMGTIGSNHAMIGVEITDSAYVVANMHIMTRVGTKVLNALGSKGDFVKCLHSVGYPLVLADGKKREDVKWPCNADNKYISHFPETKEIWSFGSGYGGNALLGKKCLALRISSSVARKEGWLAEHMLILKITSPEKKSSYIAAAFPSACGKTNLAMLTPTIPGWKVETIGDDIAWIKYGEDGRLYAVNPEAGFFGVAPGTNYGSNPNAMDTLRENIIFTNCALTEDGDIWWEQMTTTPPDKLIDWKGNEWTPDSKTPAAHPNARFTAPARQCPVIAPEWEDPKGVPLSAILFGGRRATNVPLVVESLSWQHGVFLGSTVSSEQTAAAEGTIGELRRDPMAMLPFCGYHMGDYFKHWLEIGKEKNAKLPKIYYVNWFRKSKDGKFLWPGYGENSRVLKWIVERTQNKAKGNDTALGVIPSKESLDLTKLDISDASLDILLGVDKDMWLKEIPSIEEHFKKFGNKLPQVLVDELNDLKDRLAKS